MNVIARTSLIIALFIAAPILAQPGDPGNPDNPVPIGGIEILLASGCLLGIRKILGRNRK
jgi:hypothetical protein